MVSINHSENQTNRLNLGDLFRRDLDFQKIALIDVALNGQSRQFTYFELDALANAVARGLENFQLQRGSRIAVIGLNSAEYIAAFLGIMRAGLVVVPVNSKFPAAMVDFVLQDSDAQLIFCDSENQKQLPKSLPQIVLNSFDQENKSSFQNFLNHGSFKSVSPEENELAMLLYTSGSTGKPKGVRLSHASHVWVAKTRLGNNDWSNHRYLVAAPLYHMNALAMTILNIWAHATAILLPQFNAQHYIKAIEEYRCTWLTAVPPMIAMMLQEKEFIQKTDLSSVEFLRMGSAPVTPSLLEAIREVFPHTQVINAFGTTEGSPVMFGPHPDGLPLPFLSAGYAHSEVKIRLVDELGQESNQGVLQIKSPGVMLGYHKPNDRSPPLKNPFTDDGYYVTGDMFKRNADGFYFFIGRSDDMFVCGGENIFPAEVEGLIESHPAVSQAIVLAVDDSIKGQKPVAFVVKKPNVEINESELKAFCLNNAPAYQHPRQIWFLDQLPLASTNKVDKALLKQQAILNMSKLEKHV
jgi:long-chain acyl-CoA synthetase